jgi:protein-S-isoprenylcysteine O-methyltransferase Ste14
MTKVLPPVYFVAAIALIIAVHFLFPVAVFIPYAWRFVGLLPVAAGIALNIAADHRLKQFNTTVKPFERSNALVTEGVFRWSRNPMYLGMILIVAGIALLEGSVAPWVIVAVLAVVLDRVFIVREEKMLQETFSAAFERYRQRVRRWL